MTERALKILYSAAIIAIFMSKVVLLLENAGDLSAFYFSGALDASGMLMFVIFDVAPFVALLCMGVAAYLDSRKTGQLIVLICLVYFMVLACGQVFFALGNVVSTSAVQADFRLTNTVFAILACIVLMLFPAVKD